MLERLRLRLAQANALPQLALLGILTGLLAGLVIIAFRFSLEYMQGLYLPGGGSENYEELAAIHRFWLPIAGGLFIGLVFHYLGYSHVQVGVAHVMERLAYHQGHLPFSNLLLQFFGAITSIASGHSVGREGPSVHIGASNGSLIGQWLGLPNNSIRTLVACGVAAAIAASFNTPMAGVIFAMEVVMMEYTLSSIAPVILAAVSGTAVTRLVFGSAPAFTVPPLEMGSLLELPYVLLTGIIIGALAAAFIALFQFFSTRLTERPLWIRTTSAGLIVALCAQPFPEVMGIGYDTANEALLGQLGLTTLLGIVIFKLLATTAGLGLGLPAGLIGPTIVIGATAGGVLGVIGSQLFPEHVSSHGLYALIGMGAMMGATLQAPMAALMAILELTANPNILLPGMLAVITAGMTSSELFGKGPIFLELMRARGLDYSHDPVAQSLRRLGVAAIMKREYVTCPAQLSRQEAESILEKKPHWLLLRSDQIETTLLEAADLANHLQHALDAETIDLLNIPAASRIQPPAIPLQATLQEALDKLDSLNDPTVYALYVISRKRYGTIPVHGIVTRHDIETNYRYISR